MNDEALYWLWVIFMVAAWVHIWFFDLPRSHEEFWACFVAFPPPKLSS